VSVHAYRLFHFPFSQNYTIGHTRLLDHARRVGTALAKGIPKLQLGKLETALSHVLSRIEQEEPFVRQAAIVAQLRTKVDLPLPLLEEIAGYLAIAKPMDDTKSLVAARIPGSVEFEEHLKLAMEHVRFQLGHLAQDPGFESQAGDMLRTSPSLLEVLLWLMKTHHTAITSPGDFTYVPIDVTFDHVLAQSQDLRAQMESLLAACSGSGGRPNNAIKVVELAHTICEDLAEKTLADSEVSYMSLLLSQIAALVNDHQLGGGDVVNVLLALVDLAKPTTDQLLPDAVAWLTACPTENSETKTDQATCQWHSEQAARAFSHVDFKEGQCVELIAQLGCYNVEDEVRPIWRADAPTASPVYCLQAIMAGSLQWELLQAQLPSGSRYSIGELSEDSDTLLVLAQLQALLPLDDVATSLQWSLLHQPTRGDMVPWLEAYATGMRFVMDVDGNVYKCTSLVLADVLAAGIPCMVAGALVSHLVDAQHANALIETTLESDLQDFFKAAQQSSQLDSESTLEHCAKWLLSVLELLPVVTIPLLGACLLKSARNEWEKLVSLLPNMVTSHRQAKALQLVGLALGTKQWLQLPAVVPRDTERGLFSILASPTPLASEAFAGQAYTATAASETASEMSSAMPSRTTSNAVPQPGIESSGVPEDAEQVYEAIRRRFCVHLEVLSAIILMSAASSSPHDCSQSCQATIKKTSPRCVKSWTIASLVRLTAVDSYSFVWRFGYTRT
jgi:hypothetical protein